MSTARMGKVHLDALPWLAETLGIEATSEEDISDQDAESGMSVRDLLNRLCARYQRFGKIVFDVNAQKLTGRVAIFHNGRVLEMVSGLESKLSDGDNLTFVTPIEGG
ncbi:MAG: MoaD/ThiS family protein [Chloroflexota bacterium]